ncbi:MAG: hypothetical protein ACFFAY_16270, partial [Promethearchaeota archaeon]
IQSEMLLYYRLRSHIVHGFNESAIGKLLRRNELNMSQVASRLQDLLRESIKRFIFAFNEGMSRNSILEDIDQRMLK